MDIKLAADFKEFLKLLDDHKVLYLLIGGSRKEKIFSACFSDGEIKLWDMHSLTELKSFPISKCLTGNCRIAGSYFYISSRAIHGIDRLDLKNII